MRRRGLAAVLSLVMLLALLMPAAAAEGEVQAATEPRENPENRFNVMLVLDASVSLNATDPRGNRFEAVRLFTDLLADEGNVLGGVVFSTKVDKLVEPKEVNGREEKEAVVNALKDVSFPGGWTNIGLGLTTALEQLEEHGDASLPSVIILFSDGNTAMETGGLTFESEVIRDLAMEKAAEQEIPIYSVCLNYNGSADSAEMARIAEITKGGFTEVQDANDLQQVFQVFYELIYSSRSMTLVDDVFPEEGLIETPFEVPGFGVEEVNIVIVGRATDVALTRPDGEPQELNPQIRDTFTSFKIPAPIAGEWILSTWGVPDDSIRIEVIYNTRLALSFNMSPSRNEFEVGDEVAFRATLSMGNVRANSLQAYSGYEAVLSVYDENGGEIRRIPMYADENGFEVRPPIEEGVYSFGTTVTGNSLERVSQRIGPVRFYVPEPEPEPEPVRDPIPEPPPIPNTPPTASTRNLTETVMVWPFVGGKYTRDLNGLVHDLEDSSLDYTATSPNLRQGAEYYLSPTGHLQLTLGNFRLRSGSLTVKAADSEGQSCDVTLNFRVINTVLILLGLLAAGLIAAAIYLLTRRKPAKTFGGSLTVTTEVDGSVRTSAPHSPAKGRYPLSSFTDIDNVGLDYSRCYIEGSGGAYVFLVTDKPVEWRGYETNSVRIDSGTETTVLVEGNPNRKLKVRFDSASLAFSDYEY